MLYVGLIEKLRVHPNVIVQQGSIEKKIPKYMADDVPVFTYDGFYNIKPPADNKTA